MTVTYPDGSTKHFESGATFMDAAKAISDRLDVIVEEDRALRQQNLNEVVSQLYR